MRHKSAEFGKDVLILAPFGRDAESVSKLLNRDGYRPCPCPDVTTVASRVDDSVGAVILTEEALGRERGQLRAALDAQPPWSDLPFIVLAARRMGPLPAGQVAVLRIWEVVDNYTVLERPLSSASLLSAVSSAMRSRQRQFEMRDHLASLADSQEELRESEAKFQAIANSIDHMVWSTTPDGHHDYYNQRWYEFTGVPAGSTDGDAWAGVLHPDDLPSTRERWTNSLATGAPYHSEYRLRHRSGNWRWVLVRAQPLRASGGHIVRWFGTCTDIQEIVQARQTLARSREELEGMVAERTAELARANEHLHQAQKMEAVGQLTGGIAHDFNNMLTGVIGSLDIIRRRLVTGRLDDLDRFMDAATTSATRAAGLTQRLLAFSRRQSLDSKPIDINALIESLGDLLSRTIGEQIALGFDLDGDLPPGIADANQLESAILNLAINARDAMSSGGELTLRTYLTQIDAVEAARMTDASAGRYVVVAVSDSGTGMPPELIDKVFEPFFTTKPIGQGTGLGLSMIYGFTQQSGGHVTIESVEGEGTTVSIYLPAGDRICARRTENAVEAPQGAGQCVLVVEDDPSVRLLIRDVLEEVGYSAIEAGDGAAAVPILASDIALDLMISDVGLPGMSGRQLADAARVHRPELPILFVTGYAENAAIRADFLGTNMAMITKPFSLDDLGQKIGEILANGKVHAAER